MAWVSRANAMQRKGRAGRVASGVCLHLYTNHRFQYHLRDQPVPGLSTLLIIYKLTYILMFNIKMAVSESVQ